MMGSAQDYLARADALRDHHEWYEALLAYAEYLALHPDDAGIWVQYGHCVKEAGSPADALDCYRHAAHLMRERSASAEIADLHLQIGHALKLLGRIEEARREYEIARDLGAPEEAILPELERLDLIPEEWENTQRRDLDRAVRSCVRDNELGVLWDPFVAPGSTRLLGYRAKLSWRSSQIGKRSVAEFFYAAEAAGLLPEITAWMLERACSEIQSMPGEGRFFVRLVAAQVLFGAFEEALATALATSGVDPARLCLELTEVARFAKGAREQKIAQAVAKRGVEIRGVTQSGVVLDMADLDAWLHPAPESAGPAAGDAMKSGAGSAASIMLQMSGNGWAETNLTIGIKPGDYLDIAEVAGSAEGARLISGMGNLQPDLGLQLMSGPALITFPLMHGRPESGRSVRAYLEVSGAAIPLHWCAKLRWLSEAEDGGEADGDGGDYTEIVTAADEQHMIVLSTDNQDGATLVLEVFCYSRPSREAAPYESVGITLRGLMVCFDDDYERRLSFVKEKGAQFSLREIS